VEGAEAVIVVIMGPPGCGKGTQADRISDCFGFRHLSTGQMLRKEIQEVTPLGRQVEDLISRGELAPDDLINELVLNRLRRNFHSHPRLLLDGYPRTVGQLQFLEQSLKAGAMGFTGILYLDVDEPEIIERLAGRLTCSECGTVYHTRFKPPKQAGRCNRCGGELATRADDLPDSVRERLRIYQQQTQPILDAVGPEQRLIRVRADGPPGEVFEQVREQFRKLDIEDQKGGRREPRRKGNGGGADHPEESG